MRERDVVAGRHVQFDDLEGRALGLSLEERGPGVAVLLDAAQPGVRRWHVEHHYVRIMICQNGIQITDVYRVGPPGDELTDGGFITHRVTLRSMVS
jgi:hypothetical protein